jgi:predicted peptidase
MNCSAITLTGISTGGTGTWIIGARYADRFCALVPMCGYGDGEDVAILTHLPIWMFHNSGDPVVLATFSSRMYDKLKEAGANVQYTEYGSIGHNCWDRAYNESKLWTWIADQQRR